MNRIKYWFPDILVIQEDPIEKPLEFMRNNSRQNLLTYKRHQSNNLMFKVSCLVSNLHHSVVFLVN